ncbi:class I SAM-dependent methyltransferase [Streptomyces sp. DT20]|uniref:class I SAM-dependent methyltransferase n=1 Tax=Streptomyces sp. DT20 TaxID=3416519 RepID=UPI003CE90211
MPTHTPTAVTPSVTDVLEVRRHPLCGPSDRMPVRYRGPHRLGHAGWLGFTGRLERREEIALVRSATAANHRVLDVGGGTGELTRAVASQLGHCTTVEPHGSRVATLNAHAGDSRTGTVEPVPGHAESLPFPDRSFDAVLAAWVLPYVDDLEQSVREMARVCDIGHPQARIVLIGGAPDNELVGLLNETCVPLSGEPLDHQGFLLATAAEILAPLGFRHFSLHRTEAALHFPETAPEERVHAAAGSLVNLWYEDHPRAPDMRRAIAPALRRHFARRPHAIGDQGVALIARPNPPQE